MPQFFRIFVASFLIVFSGALLAKTYRIGVLVPLSGSKADRGIPLKNAVELFVEQFNASAAAGGNKLEVVVKDDFDDPEKAKVAAAELVKDESLLAVIGHYYPATAMATAKIFGDAQIPFISPNVSSPAFFGANKWMFTVNLSDEIQGGFMAVYIKEVLKKDNVLLLHATDPFGVSLRDAFIRKASRIGLNVLKVLPVDSLIVPADWVLKNLPDTEANKAFGIVVPMTHSEAGLTILPKLRDHGIKVPLMAPSTWSNPKFLTDLDEKYTRDVYLASSFLWEMANQKASRFAQAYTKKFGARPPVAAAMAFDAALLLSHAIEANEAAATTAASKASAAPTRASIREFLVKLDLHRAIEGVTGNLFFNNAKDKTAEYVARFTVALNDEKAPPKDVAKTGAAVSVAKGAPVAAPEPAAPLATATDPDGNRAIRRDTLVSVMKDGRFKTASVQLMRPREEYVLRELPERVKKGQVVLADSMPYHIVDVVFVGVDIIRINDVNIKDMQWDVDVFMWFKWSGSRLDPKDIEKIGAVNAVRETSAILKEDFSEAIKYRAYRKRLTLGAPYDLSKFPFDAQTLPLSIAHANKNSTHVMLVPDSRHMEATPVQDIKPQEWRYVGRNIYSDLYRYESTFGDPDYRLGTNYKSPIYFSTVNMEIGLKRILQPYLFTFFLPLIIILGIILLVLWVPLDQFAPRINASISGLVGILVYHMSQKNSFPKVGYTMVADYYFLTAYALVVAMIIGIIFTQTLISKGQKDDAKKWNFRFSIGSAIAAVGVYSFMTLSAI
ncbi:MAG: ABC transporter substrate-binding protein [Burkholderiales bacterium]|nr:ABC transporter substrate-binding protein [Burkholderiales bacterium]